jgi:chaperone modulatory protein CbpM
MDHFEFLARAHLEPEVLEAWVAAGWLMPTDQEKQQFLEIDLAREQLIQDLKNDIGVNDEGVAVTLSPR